jgi:hypothetical protein
MTEVTETPNAEQPKAKRANANAIKLPTEGVNPPMFVRMMSKHLLVTDPKRIRQYLRDTFPNHVAHSSWQLKRTHMIAILGRFGTDRAKSYAAKAKAK